MILIMFLFSRWSGGQVSRYGARRPLIIGPLIVALGFMLFTLPSVGGIYWKTFFPAIVALGTGMTTTIAPLTTIVMNSVSQDRVGTASGINNAVARVAGVLAIAVLGIVMFKTFGARLEQNLAHHNLPSHVVEEIQANKIKLAGMPLPADVDPETRALLRQAIGSAFVFGFRFIMLICACLAATSVAVAWLTLPKDNPKLHLPSSTDAQPQRSFSGPSH
jgi:predicted MFS family arabinose efflux permease